jgi:hypothetical protein
VYQELLLNYKRQRSDIEEIFFEEKLLLGPFIVEVGKLRKKLIKRLDELQQILGECIKKKV